MLSSAGNEYNACLYPPVTDTCHPRRNSHLWRHVAHAPSFPAYQLRRYGSAPASLCCKASGKEYPGSWYIQRRIAGTLQPACGPSAENASTVELLYCFKVLSCGSWHAPITGPTTTSCVGGICMVVNFFQILTEGILARILHAIARRPD